jgi:quercetin 2,3-dioxygenase
MITVRPGDERGHANHGWLDTHFTFSFADYYDPEHMGFRSLRVINEDIVEPAQGFGTHPHRDMEIITYVLEGALEHKDSLGTTGVIRPGEVQRITAGAGVQHSEFNHSETDSVHLLQIWILPEKKGLKPEYEQKKFDREALKGQLRLIAARDGRDGAVKVHQDVSLYAGALPTGGKVVHSLKPGRHAWLQVARGAVTLNGQSLRAGDGAAVSDEEHLEIAATKDAEVLLFDLA